MDQKLAHRDHARDNQLESDSKPIACFLDKPATTLWFSVSPKWSQTTIDIKISTPQSFMSTKKARRSYRHNLDNTAWTDGSGTQVTMLIIVLGVMIPTNDDI